MGVLEDLKNKFNWFKNNHDHDGNNSVLISSDDEKVKASSTDTTADYLDGKVDNITIQVNASNKLETISSYTAPTLGSEVAILGTVISSSRTDTVKIETAVTTHGNLQYGALKISRAISSLITNIYIIPSTTGTEVGSTSWAKIFTLPSGGSGIIQLPLGQYRIYCAVSGGGSSFYYSLDYKIVNSGISYT